jgi:sugar phosphate isomerase/epimerase
MLKMFLEQTHLNLGFCFDIGHANIGEGVEAAYTSMRDRIRSTHLHDNDGVNDSHLFPFVADGGTVNWKRGMQLLASRPEQYPLLLELKEAPQIAQPLEAVKKMFERMEELAVPEPV